MRDIRTSRAARPTRSRRRIGGGGGGGAAQFIGAGATSIATTTTRVVDVHADTIAGDRVFVCCLRPGISTAPNDHAVWDLRATAVNDRIKVYEVIAEANTAANGITFGASGTTSIYFAVTYRGGEPATCLSGRFGTTAEWLLAGNVTCTWPTFTPPTEGIYCFTTDEANGARTWTRATELRHANNSTFGGGVARQSTPNADPVVMATSIAGSLAWGAYISL